MNPQPDAGPLGQLQLYWQQRLAPTINMSMYDALRYYGLGFYRPGWVWAAELRLWHDTAQLELVHGDKRTTAPHLRAYELADPQFLPRLEADLVRLRLLRPPEPPDELS